MRRLVLIGAVAVLCAGPYVPISHCDQVETMRIDGIEKIPPSPATLAIWTDKLGYVRRRDLIHVYLAMDPSGDRRAYRTFMYLENIKTRERRYIVRHGGLVRFRNTVVDVHGNSPRVSRGARIRQLPPTKIWTGTGRAFEAGLWQFVAELRSPDTTEIVKKAYAKFIVSATTPELLGGRGRDTEITKDTIWTNDKIYAIRHQVFVNAGATLTIEPGTLILGHGPNAVIVVERGGRIEAHGRRDAPIVMTCDEPVGQRFEGCWGGVVVLGYAPMGRGSDWAPGILPANRSAYGGQAHQDSSGALQYVRIEFAGSITGSSVGPAGLGLYGVGSGTLVDHVQVHASAADGILFAGGTANCRYCVASGAQDDALTWALGWRGTAQYMFLQLGPDAGDHAIEGENDREDFNAFPRSRPKLYNLTLVRDRSQGPAPGSHASGILLHSGSEAIVRNAIVIGFQAGAVDAWDSSLDSFWDRSSRFGNAIFHANGEQSADAQINERLHGVIGYQDVQPTLIKVQYQSSPDPRPIFGSPALRVGAGAVPPSDGWLDPAAQFVGAFAYTNWLDEWTFFGPESDYRMHDVDD